MTPPPPTPRTQKLQCFELAHGEKNKGFLSLNPSRVATNSSQCRSKKPEGVQFPMRLENRLLETSK